LTSLADAREDDRMKARYTLRPQHPTMKPPVYAMRFELPEPRKGMIRAFIFDVAAATLAVTAGLALMVDG
jgi:hypothetical protein